MIRLTYASTFNGDISAADVDAIVSTSARNNEALGITGIIAVEGRRVCQLLEGEGPAVDELYARILVDDRHSGIVQLERRQIRERIFAGWAMTRRPMVDIVLAAYDDRPAHLVGDGGAAIRI